MRLGRLALAAALFALLAGCAPHEHHLEPPKLNKAMTGTGSSGSTGVHVSSGGSGAGSTSGGSTTGGSTSGSGGLCAQCQSDADCSGGGYCVGDDGTSGNCTEACLADGGCAATDATCFVLTDAYGRPVGTGCFPSSTQCATGSSGSCAGYADPTTPAPCTCASGHTCAPNNCYGGWYCDLATAHCVAPPSGCGGSSGSTGSGGGICAPCRTDADCAAGGYCVQDGIAGSFCTAPCGSNNACPADDTCYQVGSSGAQTGCYPSSQTCDAAGGTTGGSGCTADTWTGFAEPFLEQHCAACHSWVDSQLAVQRDAADIAYRIRAGQMPPGGGLAASDVDRIVQYLNCGAP